MEDKFKFRIRAAKVDIISDGIQLFGFQRTSESRAAAQPLIMKEHVAGISSLPFATIGETQAQILMDDLWACGLRPTEGKGSAGAMIAVQDHLADMRKIVFKKLGI